MQIKKLHIYIAGLSPCFGTEPGKQRPVVVVQTNMLNEVHPSTVVCPITTNVVRGATLLRIHLTPGKTGLKQASDILVDQIRAIDNKRFVRRVGQVSVATGKKLMENLSCLILE